MLKFFVNKLKQYWYANLYNMYVNKYKYAQAILWEKIFKGSNVKQLFMKKKIALKLKK